MTNFVLSNQNDYMDENTGALFWKIEKRIKKGDYLYSLVPKHPKATKNGYVLEHRVVMENHLGRLLDPNEVVHHRNGDKHDNRLENLEVMDYRKHSCHHASKGRAYVELKCPYCKKTFHREKRQTHYNKPSQWTACSSKCRGKFSRMIQLQGITKEVEEAISGNTVRHYVHGNPEETAT